MAIVTLPIVQGTDENWDLQANTPLGPASGNSSLLETDIYTADLWHGGNSPTMFEPAIAWLSAATVNMAISATQSDALNYGVTYPVNVYRDRGSIHECIGTVNVVCLAAPSS